ncbi:hypothetical protein [Mesorhizobium sp. M7A.F.Ca.US.011.01.1.1]|uniref:hypothetical protein n=1 Tax=Mesorhizobium sp. M7A.F.Ca.US.011.01.1.1 TaxID=2496741 RepID=UPI001FDEB1F4|nr:hypothetical protein [Mesorhizobium sp. M7A.F.Ca.US.011.01.1.1]
MNGGAIVASNATDAQELQRLVADACSLRDGAMPGTGGTLMVPSDHRRSDLTRLVLSVAPFVDARAYGLASERCAVIMVTEVARRIPDGFELHVRSLFDLTSAEARLAAALASRAEAEGSRGKLEHHREDLPYLSRTDFLQDPYPSAERVGRSSQEHGTAQLAVAAFANAGPGVLFTWSRLQTMPVTTSNIIQRSRSAMLPFVPAAAGF